MPGRALGKADLGKNFLKKYLRTEAERTAMGGVSQDMLLLPHGGTGKGAGSRARAVLLCLDMQLSAVAGVAEGPKMALETLRSPDEDRSQWLDGWMAY